MEFAKINKDIILLDILFFFSLEWKKKLEEKVFELVRSDKRLAQHIFAPLWGPRVHPLGPPFGTPGAPLWGPRGPALGPQGFRFGVLGTPH